MSLVDDEFTATLGTDGFTFDESVSDAERQNLGKIVEILAVEFRHSVGSLQTVEIVQQRPQFGETAVSHGVHPLHSRNCR